MKKIFAALGIVTFALVGCDDSSSASSNDDPGVESSSSEAVFSSSSSEQFFVPSEYRTCDKKYEGKFLLYQYEETLDAWYGTYGIKTVFYKCENGKWLGPLDTAPENETGGDVIRVVSSKDLSSSERGRWECNAENEGHVESWRLYMYACKRCPMGHTPDRYARCEQGDWVVCEPESSSSSSEKSKSSSSKNEESSSSEKLSSSEGSSLSSSSFVIESSSSSVAASSSSHEILVGPCKTETEDNCEYGTLTDERDGKTYKTVKIHNKWWMAENLDYADSAKTPSLEGKSWCYADDPENCAKYGRLYIWSAATAACPDKWHLPDHDEWYGLLLAVGGYTTAGVVLKSQSGWSSGENSVSGTDAFGFNALPAGIMFGNGTFNGLGDGTDFWSTEESLGGVVAFYLSYDYEYAGLLNYDKNYAFSVRCVKD